MTEAFLLRSARLGVGCDSDISVEDTCIRNAFQSLKMLCTMKCKMLRRRVGEVDGATEAAVEKSLVPAKVARNVWTVLGFPRLLVATPYVSPLQCASGRSEIYMIYSNRKIVETTNVNAIARL